MVLRAKNIWTFFQGRLVGVDIISFMIIIISFLAVQDSSISDIVGLSVPWSEPTNNQSLGIIKE